MDVIRIVIRDWGRGRALLAGLCAGMVLLGGSLAAQEGPPPRLAPPPEQPDVFTQIGRWFDRQLSGVGTSFQDAGRGVENFGREAGIAARTTVSGARDAADAMARISNTRVVRGHEKCRNAPNGAPDCVAAANAICRVQGYNTGKSVDMTTAEICPPKVYMSGRNTGPECRTETFVSSALCQ